MVAETTSNCPRQHIQKGWLRSSLFLFLRSHEINFVNGGGESLYLLNCIKLNNLPMKNVNEYVAPQSVVLILEIESPILEGSDNINNPGIGGPDDSGWITNK